MRYVYWLFVTGLTTLTAACAGEDGDMGEVGEEPVDTMEAAAPAPAAGEAAVRIVEPVEGATVQGPDVRVVLENEGFEIVLAGDTTPNTGHHHLFLDADVSDPGQPIPTVPGSIIHMGDGSSEYVFSGVQPGQHRLIAVVGDGLHVPVQPMLTDTVTFTVVEGGGG